MFPTGLDVTGKFCVFSVSFGCLWLVIGVPGFFWMFSASLSVSGQFLVCLVDFVCSQLASGILNWFWVFSGRFGVFLADWGVLWQIFGVSSWFLVFKYGGGHQG